MTLRQYLILMSLGTALSWIIWLVLLFSVAPEDAGFVGLIFFYISLGLAIMGSVSVGGFLIRRALTKNDEVIFRHVKRTFRQGILVSLLVVAILALMAASLLYWWNALLLIILFIVLEGWLLSKPAGPSTTYVQ